jgi:hypothetical protein
LGWFGKKVGDVESANKVTRGLASSPTPPAWGEWCPTSDGGKGAKFLTDGWCVREGWGVWTKGVVASIVIPLPPLRPSLPLQLGFRTFGFIAEAVPQQGATIFVYGKKMARWEWKYLGESAQAAERVITVPFHKVAKKKQITIDIKIDHPTIPAAIGYNDDPRPIGVALEALALFQSSASTTN